VPKNGDLLANLLSRYYGYRIVDEDGKFLGLTVGAPAPPEVGRDIAIDIFRRGVVEKVVGREITVRLLEESPR